MNLGEACSRVVIFGLRRTSAPEMARLMREHHVGDLVIVDETAGRRIPVGIVTDRDLALEILAQGVDPNAVVAQDIMSAPVLVLEENRDCSEALDLMRRKGLRRVPVVDAEGSLVGILALDDLIELLAEELNALARAVRQEQSRERERRPLIMAGPRVALARPEPRQGATPVESTPRTPRKEGRRMSFSGIDAIDSSLQKTNKWLSEIYEELNLNTPEAAWFALHRVLHALRDRLPPEEVLQLSAQLPLIVRGAFIEGWRPQVKPERIRTVEEFLRPLEEMFSFKGEIEAEPAVRAVFGVLSRHVTAGEISDVKACLPAHLRELWPESMAA